MALSRNRRDEVPKDAVILSTENALAYQNKLVQTWDKQSEVWAIRHTPGILACFSGMTGIFVNNHFRTKLKLGLYGQFATYLPIVAVPAMFSMLAHKTFIHPSILLNSFQECPLCTQLRASAIQAGLGVVYPTILAPFAAFMFATRHFTYRLPSITEQPREVFNLWKKFTKPITSPLATIMTVQTILVMYLTYKEMEQNIRLNIKMRYWESQIDSSIS